jgi:hypothetical protein
MAHFSWRGLLDWIIKERASQNFFRLVFLPGLINPADFFTKLLPVCRHIATLPFLHGTPHHLQPPHLPILRHPPTHHTPPSHTFQSPQCSPRQGSPYLSPTLTQPHFILTFPTPMPACNASNKPSLPPVPLPHLYAENPTHLTIPAPAPPPDVGFKPLRVFCIFLAYVLA